MTVTCHSKMLESSTRPAEKPSTGFFVSSGNKNDAVGQALEEFGLRMGWAACMARVRVAEPHLSAACAAATPPGSLARKPWVCGATDASPRV